MAIYHLSVKTISRSAGRTATAAAAYRAGVSIADEQTGEIHDYTRKGGVESASLILPDNVPDWAHDRCQLWNEAERAEKRKNSTVAREFEIALPSELNADQRRELAHDFTRELVKHHGCAADVAIHAPGKEGDNRNHHAHILLTTRRLTAEGMGEKARELDSAKTGAAIIKAWRERFAVLQNERLLEAGHAVQVDHRSHAERGIEAEPSRHLGPTATAIERRTGQPSRKGQWHQEDALERSQRASELERQDRQADDSITALSGDLEAAKRERAAQQERAAQAREHAERQRIERMNSTELAQEIGRIRPRKLHDLVAHDQDVLQAEQAQQDLQYRHTKASKASAQARDQAQAWREAHGFLAVLHDRGLVVSKALQTFEEERQAQHTEWLRISPRLEEASLKVRSARDLAQLRIRSEQAPALAKVAELEDLKQEKVRQEQQEQVRKKAVAAAQREHDALKEDFLSMALDREPKNSGWDNRGERWKAAPEGLKVLIEGYNAVPKAARTSALDLILRDDHRCKQVRELMDVQRQNYDRENDQGMDMSY